MWQLCIQCHKESCIASKQGAALRSLSCRWPNSLCELDRESFTIVKGIWGKVQSQWLLWEVTVANGKTTQFPSGVRLNCDRNISRLDFCLSLSHTRKGSIKTLLNLHGNIIQSHLVVWIKAGRKHQAHIKRDPSLFSIFFEVRRTHKIQSLADAWSRHTYCLIPILDCTLVDLELYN